MFSVLLFSVKYCIHSRVMVSTLSCFLMSGALQFIGKSIQPLFTSNSGLDFLLVRRNYTQFFLFFTRTRKQKHCQNLSELIQRRSFLRVMNAFYIGHCSVSWQQIVTSQTFINGSWLCKTSLSLAFN